MVFREMSLKMRFYILKKIYLKKAHIITSIRTVTRPLRQNWCKVSVPKWIQIQDCVSVREPGCEMISDARNKNIAMIAIEIEIGAGQSVNDRIWIGMVYMGWQ